MTRRAGLARIDAGRAATRPRSRLLAVLALCLALAPSRAAAQTDDANRRPDASRPNILFLFSDDHAAHAISAYGSRIVRTPNLDRLATEGMRFDRCLVTNAICAPSRAVVLTGRYSHQNRVYTNRERFDGSQFTFPKRLRDAGYQTAMIGKWHLKSDPTGFDYWCVLPGQGLYYNPTFRTAAGESARTGYVTDIITDEALDWLRNRRDSRRPFLLMCQHKAPHRSWQPGPKHLTLYDDVTLPEPPTLFDDYQGRADPARRTHMTVAEDLTPADLKLEAPENLTPEQRERWDAAYEPKNRAFRDAKLEGRERVRWNYQRYIKDYLRCVASVDENVGRLLDYLEQAGLADRTVVVYSSDQGFYLGDHGWFDKRWMYEESLRMPLLVRWPERVKPGQVDTHLVQNLDFAPTFLEMAGVKPPETLPGRSLVPLLRGQAPADWRQSVYYHYYEDIEGGGHGVAAHYGVATDRYKLIHYYRAGAWELFDREKDPEELRSRYGDPAYTAVQKELEAELTRLARAAGEASPANDYRAWRREQHRESARRVQLRQVYPFPETGDKKKPPRLDPSARPLTVGARCVPDGVHGVLVALGGDQRGVALFLRDGCPCLAVRSDRELHEVSSTHRVEPGRPVHLAGTLDAEGRVCLLVNGEVAARGEAELIDLPSREGVSVAEDSRTPVGRYEAPNALSGKVEDARIYWGVLDREAMKRWARGE
ncbi:MAG: sulfatase [Planctomycetes bacterium]|nr:sulfatase [Planctomycetota bacterium]